MRTIKIKVAAGEAYELATVGDYVRIKQANVELTIENLDSNETVTAMAGDDFQMTKFQRLRISHSDSGSQDVTLLVSTGKKANTTSGINGIFTMNGAVDIKQTGTVTDLEPVVVGVAATVLLAASATRKTARFYNGGAVDVYLGGAGVTTANGALKIPAGSAWVEDNAAGAAWYGISGTAGQSVRIQEVN